MARRPHPASAPQILQEPRSPFRAQNRPAAFPQVIRRALRRPHRGLERLPRNRPPPRRSPRNRSLFSRRPLLPGLAPLPSPRLRRRSALPDSLPMCPAEPRRRRPRPASGPLPGSRPALRFLHPRGMGLAFRHREPGCRPPEFLRQGSDRARPRRLQGPERLRPGTGRERRLRVTVRERRLRLPAMVLARLRPLRATVPACRLRPPGTGRFRLPGTGRFRLPGTARHTARHHHLRAPVGRRGGRSSGSAVAAVCCSS
jgi:hypothetical protein